MTHKKSKYRHVVINKKKYYFYKITWLDILGDSGHADNNEFMDMKPAVMITSAYVFHNDSKILRGQGIDSININPTPSLEDGELDLSPLNLCHSLSDSVDKISQSDMKTYVEEVLVPICKPTRFSSSLLAKFNIFFKIFS